MPPKKTLYNPIQPFNIDNQVPSLDGNLGETVDAEWNDFQLDYNPCFPKAEAEFTLTFNVSVDLSVGDLIHIKLTGFAGESGPISYITVDKTFPFFLYWSGEDAKLSPQTLILQVRRNIAPSTQCMLVIPFSAGICLPEKLPLSSTKLKVSDTFINAANGKKLPKYTITKFREIKKVPGLSPCEQEVNEILKLQTESSDASSHDLTLADWDHLMMCTRQRSLLRLGFFFAAGRALFTEEQHDAHLRKLIAKVTKPEQCSNHMRLHQEIAKRLCVPCALILAFEEACFIAFAQFYPKLTRSMLMMLRLWTFEASDFQRVFGIFNYTSSFQREINQCVQLLDENWMYAMQVLLSSFSTVEHTSSIPDLYFGAKDVPSELASFLFSDQEYKVLTSSMFYTCYSNLDIDDDVFPVADNGILLVIRNARDAIQITDISQYSDDTWLIPPFTRFSVTQVQQLVDKGNLMKVELTCIFDNLSELSASFKEMKSNIKQLEIEDEMLTISAARGMYLRTREYNAKRNHPTYISEIAYLEEYANIKRMSRAKKACEEHGVKWQTRAFDADPNSSWELVKKPLYIALEANLYQTSRNEFLFSVGAEITADLKFFTLTQTGKNAFTKKLRRVIGRYVSHPFNQN